MPPITDVQVVSAQDLEITHLLPFSTINLGDLVSVFELSKWEFGDLPNYTDFDGEFRYVN